MMYGGVQIIEDPNMLDWAEDWSQVRSPSRAIRRLKRGFKQRIQRTATPKKEAYQFQGKLVMHPVMAKLLREKIASEPRP